MTPLAQYHAASAVTLAGVALAFVIGMTAAALVAGAALALIYRRGAA